MKRRSLVTAYFLKYKVPYILGIIILLIVDYIQLYIPQITGMITDGIKDGQINGEGIGQLALALTGVTLVLVLGRIGWRYFIIGTSRKVETDIRYEIFNKWVEMDVAYFNTHKTGNLMAYATNDLNAIRMMVGSGLIVIVDAVVMTIMVIFKMLTYVDVSLTLMAILPMPIIAIGGAYFEKKVEERFGDKQKAFAFLSDKVQESFSGIQVIQSFVQEKYDIKDFEKISQDNYHKNLRLTRLSAILNPLMYLLVGLSLLISIGYGGYLTMINRITIGEFVAFNQYILMLNWPMMAIAMGINIFAQGIASVKRIEGVLEDVSDVQDSKKVQSVGTVKGAIKVQNLHFDFPDNQQTALTDINIEVEEGETLAILGRTGSGKSTLVNLLLRLYNSPEGSIFLDRHDIMQMPLKEVRQNIAYVPQDNFLFSDTIARNIGFGLESLEMEKVIEAAKKANVHENIVDFPHQYETVVGERGTTLSGGQKQRVSIARAMILDAPIMILDDSLSAVDTKTEEQILSNLKKIRQGKTNIIIAHRISTVKHADKIIVLENGHIAEYGNHETLMARAGIYAEMTRQQRLEEEINET